MIQHRVKHLEPVHIGYSNEWMDVLVTEDGSKFYKNGTVFQKSIDIMVQNLSEKDKEMFYLMCQVPQMVEGLSNKHIFYLSEKEYYAYCEESLKYLETSDSHECRSMKNSAEVTEQRKKFHNWNELDKLMKTGLENFMDSRKIQGNWRSRAAPNGKGVEGQEFARVMTMVNLAISNVQRGAKQIRDLKTFQSLNKGRKVILRMMCDKRVEDYDEWFIFYEDIMEACTALLREEGRLETKSADLYIWTECDHQTHRQTATVKELEKFLEKLEINADRLILVPDIHFIRQWIELPLKVDYTCATVLRPDGEVYYRPIQAALRFFEFLACEIDWNVASQKNSQKTERLRNKIIECFETCQKCECHNFELIEAAINFVGRDSFFSESNKRKMKTPLFICQRKKYNDKMAMSEFRKFYELYFDEQTSQDDFWKSDWIEIWKVRQIFMIRWIDMFLSSDQKQLSMDLKAALTMQTGFLQLNDAEEMNIFCTTNEMDRFVDYNKMKMFEEMSEKSRIKKLDVPSKKNQKMKKLNNKRPILDNSKKEEEEELKVTVDQVQESPKNPSEVPGAVDENKVPMTDGIFDRLFGLIPTALGSSEGGEELEAIDKIETEKAKECDEKEKKFHNEIEVLKRQLAEKSKLLEDQSTSYEMQIQQLQNELIAYQKLIEENQKNAQLTENNLRGQADKIKQDNKTFKTENHRLNEKLGEKDERIKQLEIELKENRENAKNEQVKKSSEKDNQSKITGQKMKKIEAELVMAKLIQRTNTNEIDKLKEENGQLKDQITNLEKQIATNAIIHEKNGIIRVLTEERDDLKAKYVGLSEDIKEMSTRNRKSKKSQLKNRPQKVSMKTETSVCQPSTSELHNQLEDKENIGEEASSPLMNQENVMDSRICLICRHKIENGYQNVPQCEECRTDYHNHCLSMWLGVNPNCPHCRVHWPDPQQFPAL